MQVGVCPSCGEANPAPARLCGMCRATLAADTTGGDGGKLVTVVTSDLKGSTALGEKLDPESLREVLNRYFAVMRVVFEAHGGSIEKIIGDAIVAVFGLPFRHEDDPIRAVEAAAETQRALTTPNDEIDMLWGGRLVERPRVAAGGGPFGGGGGTRGEGGEVHRRRRDGRVRPARPARGRRPPRRARRSGHAGRPAGPQRGLRGRIRRPAPQPHWGQHRRS